uniref:Uncharacterized protein n=1 Tax=Glossina palpalis gambiensis TaxID=67801 RepID=A0A1B0AV19_9MUSC
MFWNCMHILVYMIIKLTVYGRSAFYICIISSHTFINIDPVGNEEAILPELFSKFKTIENSKTNSQVNKIVMKVWREENDNRGTQ